MTDTETPPDERETTVEHAEQAHRWSGWFTRMSLRGRLSILTAAAVAVAIAVCAATCWFVVKGQLNDQAKQSLTNISINSRNMVVTGTPNPYFYCGYSIADALAKVSAADAAVGTPGNAQIQPTYLDTELIVATTTGTQICLPLGATRGIETENTDVANAQLTTLSPGQAVIRHGSYSNGQPALVRIASVSVQGQQETLLIAYPLHELQRSLQYLAIVLICVAAIGALGAAGIGLVVARAALKPVDKLTDAVEHIARTQEPGTTIDVHGSDEIARLSESFNSMSTALASSRDRQSQLIADAGHELRTPLTSLRTNVDLLVRSEETGRALPEDTRSRMLRNMKAQMVELSTLIGDLLELSRPTRPKGSRPLEVLPLHDIAARALDRARLRGPGLVFNVQLEPWFVRADAHTMERAVINLLDNAVKFSPPGGAIDVRLRFGTLTVRDHGPGIPAEDLPHVFDRFWRSPSARQMPGSGLGLAIVAQTIRDAGGEVSLAAAAPGPDGSTGGALATIRLPGAPTPPPATPPLGGTGTDPRP